jgi:hypothetical protein
MVRPSKVVASDGLGNQLFQFSFAHYLGHARNTGVSILANPRAFHSTRSFVLEELISECRTVNLQVGNGAFLVRKVSDWIKIAARFNKTVSRISARCIGVRLESNEYCRIVKPKRGTHIGYFQHSIYSDTPGCLIEDIRRGLNVPTKLENHLAIHVRGGDFKDLKDMFGLLDSSYYERAIRTAQAAGAPTNEIHVVTDDLEYARDLLQNLNYNFVIHGPKELAMLPSFRFLACSKYLIIGNSTFSWWAARLAEEEGGRAWKPSRWFLNYTDPKEAFDRASFTNVTSTFSS